MKASSTSYASAVSSVSAKTTASSSSNSNSAAKSSSSSSTSAAKATSSSGSNSTEVKGMAKVDSSSQKSGMNKTNNTASSTNTGKSVVEKAAGVAIGIAALIANGNIEDTTKKVSSKTPSIPNITPTSGSTGNTGSNSSNSSSSSGSNGTSSHSNVTPVVVSGAVTQTGGVSVVQTGNNSKSDVKNIPNITVDIKKDTIASKKSTDNNNVAQPSNSFTKAIVANQLLSDTLQSPRTANYFLQIPAR